MNDQTPQRPGGLADLLAAVAEQLPQDDPDRAAAGLAAMGPLPAPRHTADTITDDALEQLYADLDDSVRQIGRLAENRQEWQDRALTAEAERDGAYRERAHLLAWLAVLHPETAVIAPATDITETGWQLLYLVAGGWQMTWHIHPDDAPLFEHVEHVSASDPRAQWDGHTTDQKYLRIRTHTHVVGMDNQMGPADAQ